MLGRLFVVGGLLCTWGCGTAAHAYEGEPSVPEPTGPATATQEGPLPTPASKQPVTLQQILAWAREKAPDVVVAQRRLALGEAAEEGAEPLLPSNPQASLQVGPRSKGGTSGIDIRGTLVQRLEIAGERRQRLQAAEQTQQRLQAELAQTRWNVHQRVHLAFYRALLARERMAMQKELHDFQHELLEYAQKRLAAGAIADLDVRIVEAEAAEAKQRLIRAKQQYRAARLQLAEVAGWPAAHPPEPAGELPPPREAPAVSGLMQRALRHNPALHRQAQAIEEARAQVDVADRDAWPEPAIGVLAAREDPGGGQGANIVRGIVQLPLSVWRRNQGERARTRAELGIAMGEDQAIRSVLRKRVARTADAVDAAAERVEVYSQKVLPQFETNLKKLRRAFELGEIDILDVSVARERFLRIQRAALDTYGSYFEAIAELEAQLGTGIWRQ